MSSDKMNLDEIQILFDKAMKNGQNSTSNKEVASTSSSNVKTPKHTPISFPTHTPIVNPRIGQTSAPTTSIPKAARKCYLCDTPISPNQFLIHVLGKKHQASERKCKMTKEQKTDRDDRSLYMRGK